MTTHPYAKLRVLVADPAPHMTTLVAAMLRQLGLRDIRTAAAMADADALLQTAPLDLALIDEADVDWDGIDMVRRLRRARDSVNRDIPVIMTSRAPDAARIRAARDAGVTEFLRKPFAAHDIDARLKAIRNMPRPFIEADGYAGPDRRRRTSDFQGTERRGSR